MHNTQKISWLWRMMIALLALFFMRISFAQFLPPEQAFAFSAHMRDGGNVSVTFNIAPNYYMYRDEFAFNVVSPDGQVMQNGAVKLPPAKIKFDENFNKDMAIYHGRVNVNVPVKGEGLFKIVVTSRGCADGGLCYPPRKTQAVLTAASGNAQAAAPAASRPDNTTKANDVTAIVPDKKVGLSEQSKSNAKEADAAAALEKSASKSPDSEKTAANVVQVAPVAAAAPISAEPSLSLGGEPVTAAQSTNNSSLDNSAYARNLFATHNLPMALVLMFGLGILLSLTPCMLPMVPILSSIIAGQHNVSRKRGFTLALAYVTGMAVVYAVIGVIAAQTGASLHRYLQSPWVLGALSIMLLLLALSLFDVFQLQMPARWQAWLNSKTQGKNGYWGVALMGAASAIIASPCVTAPLVGVITYIAQTGNTVLGGLALFVLAYGMGVPLLLLGAGMGQFLPKSGAWMVRIKQIIGLIMVAAALWIAQPLWGKYWQNAWGDKVATVTFQPVKSVAVLNQVVATSDKPVFVDLYADWCRSCIEMEKKTFPDPRVQERLAKLNLVRIDMTAYTDEDAAVLAHFGLYGPPGMLILEPMTGKEKMRVIGYESPDAFVKSLDAALGK